MLYLVEGSLSFVVLSATIVLGSWTAFYCYIGHNPGTNMEFVTQAYHHFFGVFVDYQFRWPELFSFDFSSISQWSAVLEDVPAFNAVPPDVTLEGSRVFAALSLIVAFVKPLVSAIAFLSSTAGLVAENKPVSEVAMGTSSFEGAVRELVGENRVEALKARGFECEFDDEGGLVSVKATNKNVHLDIGSLKDFIHLRNVDLEGCTHVIGEFFSNLCFCVCANLVKFLRMFFLSGDIGTALPNLINLQSAKFSGDYRKPMKITGKQVFWNLLFGP